MLLIHTFLLLVLTLLCPYPAFSASSATPVAGPVPELAARQIRFLASTTTPDRVQQQIERFAAMGSRVPGYGGAEEAARFVRSSFHALGLRDVRVDTFEVVVPVDTREGDLVVTGTAGRLLRVWGLWPNDVRTPTTRPGGIVGPLVYGGTGAWDELDGKPIEGSIVLLDFASGQNWIHVASLGARAIVFYDNGGVSRQQAEAKLLSVPVDVPRFWVGAEEAHVLLRRIAEEELQGKLPSARLEGRMDWKSAPAYNIYGWIRGMDEAMPPATRAGEQKWQDQVLVVQAYYDAMSIVPALPSGAESSASITALLEMAQVLARHHPDYSVLFLATSAHFAGMAGINDFLTTHSGTTDAIDFDLMLSLDLSSHGERTISLSSGAFFPQDPSQDEQVESVLARYSSRLSRATQQILNDSLCHVDGVSLAPKEGGSALPVPLALAGESARAAGRKALTIVTAGDERTFWDTPLDTPERVDFANLAAQIQKLTAMVMWAGKDPLLLQPTTTSFSDRGQRLTGTIHRSVDENLTDASAETVPGALVAYRYQGASSIGGVRTLITDRANAEGQFDLHIMSRRAPNALAAYEIDDASGAIQSASNAGATRGDDNRLELFDCRALSLFWPGGGRQTFVPQSVTVTSRDGTSHGAGVSAAAPVDMVGAPTASVVFAPRGSRVQVSMRTSAGDLSATLRSVQPGRLKGPLTVSAAHEVTQSQAEGHAIDQPLLRADLELGQDLWAEDAETLQHLARFGIGSDDAESLLEKARLELLAAAEHLAERRYAASHTATIAAWDLLTSGHVYVESLVWGTVVSATFYLVLLLPFAYALERLVLRIDGAARQYLASAGILLSMALLLRAIAPGFAVSSSLDARFLPLLIGALGGLALMVGLAGRGPDPAAGNRRKPLRSLLTIAVLAALLLAAQVGVALATGSGGAATVTTTIVLILLTPVALLATVWRSDAEQGPHGLQGPGRHIVSQSVVQALAYATTGIVLSYAVGRSLILLGVRNGLMAEMTINLASAPAVGIIIIFAAVVAATGVYQGRRQRRQWHP